MIYLFILLFILSNLYYHILRGGGLQCGREKLFFLGECKTRKTLFSWSKIYQSRNTSRKYWKCCLNVFRTSLDQVEKKSKNCTRKTSFLNESQAWRKIELLPLILPPPTPSPHTRFFFIFPDWNDGLSHKSLGSAELLLRKGNLLNKKLPLMASVVRREGSRLAVSLSRNTLNFGEQSSGFHACSNCSEGICDSSNASLRALRSASSKSGFTPPWRTWMDSSAPIVAVMK